MELAENINTINRQLRELFGIDTVSTNVMFRVTWSDDQFERRFGDWTDYDASNNPIRTVTESRYVPKYPFNKGRYILERLVIVPEVSRDELCGLKFSYEPLWVFQNMDDDTYLAPRIDICQFIINNVLEAQHRPKGFKRYLESQASTFGFLGGKNTDERLKEIKETLFGNETPITDALMAQRGVSLSGLEIPNSKIVLTDGDK